MLINSISSQPYYDSGWIQENNIPMKLGTSKYTDLHSYSFYLAQKIATLEFHSPNVIANFKEDANFEEDYTSPSY